MSGRSSSHGTRSRAAARLDNERREAAGTLHAARPGEREPGPREDPGAPKCKYCGLHIKLLPSGLHAAHTSKGGRPTMKNFKCAGSGVRPATESANT